MPQIKFTVTDEAATYLRWVAKNILFEKNEHDAARHFMLQELAKSRRKYRQEEPAVEGFPVATASVETE